MRLMTRFRSFEVWLWVQNEIQIYFFFRFLFYPAFCYILYVFSIVSVEKFIKLFRLVSNTIRFVWWQNCTKKNRIKQRKRKQKTEKTKLIDGLTAFFACNFTWNFNWLICLVKVKHMPMSLTLSSLSYTNCVCSPCHLFFYFSVLVLFCCWLIIWALIVLIILYFINLSRSLMFTLGKTFLVHAENVHQALEEKSERKTKRFSTFLVPIGQLHSLITFRRSWNDLMRNFLFRVIFSSYFIDLLLFFSPWRCADLRLFIVNFLFLLFVTARRKHSTTIWFEQSTANQQYNTGKCWQSKCSSLSRIKRFVFGPTLFSNRLNSIRFSLQDVVLAVDQCVDLANEGLIHHHIAAAIQLIWVHQAVNGDAQVQIRQSIKVYRRIKWAQFVFIPFSGSIFIFFHFYRKIIMHMDLIHRFQQVQLLNVV